MSTEEASSEEQEEFNRLIGLLDQKVEKFFDKMRGNPVADRIFYTASQLGDHGLIWQALGSAKALFGNKKHEKNFVRLSTSLALESILVNGVLKSLFPRERPSSNESRPHYLRQPITASFPSGHASAAALSAVLLSTGKRRRPLFLWALAGIVAASRIHVKIHHASDVLAGAAFGYALGKLVKSVWRIK